MNMDASKARQLELGAGPQPLSRPLDDQTDDALMLLTCEGQQAAFHVLVRRHQSRILRIAARCLSDRSLTTDVAQNTFLELYRNRQRYEPRGRFTAYLCRIALNQCRMSGRAARSATRGPLHELPVEELTADVILQRERRRDLDAALGKLSEKLRTVVVLQYTGDLSQSEIADALHIPIGTVKRRLFDAMAKLRELLEEPV